MRNILTKGYVIDASPELVPSIRIAPFSRLTNDFVGLCNSLSMNGILGTNSDVYIVTKGRTAINVALQQYELQKDDVVTIFTTSGNMYISSCVTKEIEKFCKWSRDITSKTKLIFVNHEFGYPYNQLADVKKYGLPIIEDCAHTLFSKDGEKGTVGDYVIYSLPKAFPVQMGGVLVANKPLKFKVEENEEVINYIMSHFAYTKEDINAIKQKRLHNYAYLKESLSSLEIKPFFELHEGVVPGVFLFQWGDDIDYPDLKEFMQRNGVESSVFYGQHAFFIPMHQNLTKKELDYMINLLWYYYDTYVNKEEKL